MTPTLAFTLGILAGILVGAVLFAAALALFSLDDEAQR